MDVTSYVQWTWNSHHYLLKFSLLSSKYPIDSAMSGKMLISSHKIFMEFDWWNQSSVIFMFIRVVMEIINILSYPLFHLPWWILLSYQSGVHSGPPILKYLMTISGCCILLYHSFTLDPTWEMKRSYLALSSLAYGLQNSSHIDHNVSVEMRFGSKHQTWYIFKPWSTDCLRSVLYFLICEKLAISASNICLTLPIMKFPLMKNLL